MLMIILQDTVKRQAVGIWKCSACKKVIAGGAWTVSTTAAATVRRCVFYVDIHITLLRDRVVQFVGCARLQRRDALTGIVTSFVAFFLTSYVYKPNDYGLHEHDHILQVVLRPSNSIVEASMSISPSRMRR